MHALSGGLVVEAGNGGGIPRSAPKLCVGGSAEIVRGRGGGGQTRKRGREGGRGKTSLSLLMVFSAFRRPSWKSVSAKGAPLRPEKSAYWVESRTRVRCEASTAWRGGAKVMAELLGASLMAVLGGGPGYALSWPHLKKRPVRRWDSVWKWCLRSSSVAPPRKT